MANLIYTLALEQAGAPGHRMLGKLLASSLLRTFFDGDVVVFRNSAAAYFQVERRGLAELELQGVHHHRERLKKSSTLAD